MQAPVDRYVCERKKRERGRQKERESERWVITVGVTGRQVVQRSVVALAVRA